MGRAKPRLGPRPAESDARILHATAGFEYGEPPVTPAVALPSRGARGGPPPRRGSRVGIPHARPGSLSLRDAEERVPRTPAFCAALGAKEGGTPSPRRSRFDPAARESALPSRLPG